MSAWLRVTADGLVRESHLRTPAQASPDVMAWLQRLDACAADIYRRCSPLYIVLS
jgi:hypothetical protein